MSYLSFIYVYTKEIVRVHSRVCAINAEAAHGNNQPLVLYTQMDDCLYIAGDAGGYEHRLASVQGLQRDLRFTLRGYIAGY